MHATRHDIELRVRGAGASYENSTAITSYLREARPVAHTTTVRYVPPHSAADLADSPQSVDVPSFVVLVRSGMERPASVSPRDVASIEALWREVWNVYDVGLPDREEVVVVRGDAPLHSNNSVITTWYEDCFHRPRVSPCRFVRHVLPCAASTSASAVTTHSVPHVGPKATARVIAELDPSAPIKELFLSLAWLSMVPHFVASSEELAEAPSSSACGPSRDEGIARCAPSTLPPDAVCREDWIRLRDALSVEGATVEVAWMRTASRYEPHSTPSPPSSAGVKRAFVEALAAALFPAFDGARNDKGDAPPPTRNDLVVTMSFRSAVAAACAVSPFADDAADAADRHNVASDSAGGERMRTTTQLCVALSAWLTGETVNFAEVLDAERRRRAEHAAGPTAVKADVTAMSAAVASHRALQAAIVLAASRPDDEARREGTVENTCPCIGCSH